MMTEKSIRPIAYIEGDFPEKFGIPRQSGLVNTQAEIHFLPEYRKPEAFRGLEEYSHLWLIWDFSEAEGTNWRPTARQGLEEIRESVYLQLDPHFVQMEWGYPV